MNFAQMLATGPRIGATAPQTPAPRTYRRTRAGEGHRVCSRCNQTLPSTEQYFRYGKAPSGRYVMRSTCRKCEGAQLTERRRRKREEARQ